MDHLPKQEISAVSFDFEDVGGKGTSGCGIHLSKPEIPGEQKNFRL